MTVVTLNVCKTDLHSNMSVRRAILRSSKLQTLIESNKIVRRKNYTMHSTKLYVI